MRVAGKGSELNFGDFLIVGGQDAKGNRLEVADGGCLTATNFFFNCGEGAAFNELCLSNGTVCVLQECAFGYSWIDGYQNGQDTVVRFQGRTPQVRVSSQSGIFHVRNGTHFVFELPVDGYETIPFVVSGWYMIDAETTTLSVTGLEARLARMRADRVAQTEETLFKCEGNVFQGPDEAMMARVNASLLEGCAFYLINPSNNGNGDFYCSGIGLRLRASFGTQVIIR
jgi:hypothetical protein